MFDDFVLWKWRTSDRVEDHKVAAEDINSHEQDPASREWRLITRRGVRGQHFRRCRYDNPFWERERCVVFFQDQENKLIYHPDAKKTKITGPLNRRFLEHFPEIQWIQAAGFTSVIF